MEYRNSNQEMKHNFQFKHPTDKLPQKMVGPLVSLDPFKMGKKTLTFYFLEGNKII